VRLLWIVVAAALLVASDTRAWSADDSDSLALVPVIRPVTPAIAPVIGSEDHKREHVQWKPLLSQSLRFLAIENAFRYVTEAGTRAPGTPFFQGYLHSVGALHGWADGDPFYVNYVGHPMQGAVSGFLWIQNDPSYRAVEFGRNREYWRSRLRAAAFAWAYSEETEIGIISEASIGNIQAKFPQQGFVDHVITPSLGLAWILAEDALDKYLVRWIERNTENRYVQLLARGSLNPSRSFANVIGGRIPWARTRSAEPFVGNPRSSERRYTADSPSKVAGVAPFELAVTSAAHLHTSGPCVGGGGTAALRLLPVSQLVVEVSGCKMTGSAKELSGDSLKYMIGSRWTPLVTGSWVPYVQLLAGGNRLTTEEMFPEKKAALEAAARISGLPKTVDHNEYTNQDETNGFAIAVGTGLDYKVNRAIAVRLGSVEYTRSWARQLSGTAPPTGFQVTAGLVLRMGTW